jgi:hypothetical protein
MTIQYNSYAKFSFGSETWVMRKRKNKRIEAVHEISYIIAMSKLKRQNTKEENKISASNTEYV